MVVRKYNNCAENTNKSPARIFYDAIKIDGNVKSHKTGKIPKQ
jgi:hypothetical protein